MNESALKETKRAGREGEVDDRRSGRAVNDSEEGKTNG